MGTEIRVVDDVGHAFAELVHETFVNRPDKNRFTIAFGGGSTARPCYEQLAKEPIDWSRVVAIWGDERCVPLDHDDSNYRIAKETVFDVCGPLAEVYPMRCEEGAEIYQGHVAELLPIDVAHLGMGDDGHTVSLFPGSPALHAPSEALVVSAGDDLHKHPRMTLTYSALAQTRLSIFTVVGANKREMFERIQAGEDFPATHVASERIVWLVGTDVLPAEH